MKVLRTFCNSLVFAVALTVLASGQERSPIRSFSLTGIELRAAIDSLLRWYGEPIVFLESDVAGKRVKVECVSCTIDQAISSILAGHGLRATRLSGQFIIRRDPSNEAPSSTYAGTIVDSLTGEPIAGATVLLTELFDDAPYRWCSTGPTGFYSLRHVPPGTYALHVRRVGYQSLLQIVTIDDGVDEVRTIQVRHRELVQPHVTVEGRRTAFAAATGISRGVFIRSAPTDHHQYYLEGARIYQPVHFGGLTFAFNGDVLRDVQMVAGGVPPFYGGRIGGVLDVSLRPGSQDALGGSVDAGTVGSGVVLEGPLDGSTSFIVSGRQSYPDIFSRGFYPDQPASDLHAAELMFKLSRSVSAHQRLEFSGYYGRDAYDKTVVGSSLLSLNNQLRWRNAAATLRWSGLAGPAMLFSASAALTEYGFNADHALNGSPGTTRFASGSNLRDLSARAHAEYYYDAFHTLLAGVELVRHQTAGSVASFSSQLVTADLGATAPWELSIYVQDQWRLLPSVLAEVGARATSFVSKDRGSSAVDPRFSIMVQIDDERRITGSVSAVTQFFHPYRHSGLFLYYPSIFFYPTGNRIPPSTSLHAAIGFEQSFLEDRYRFTAEGYGRLTRNLHEFTPDSAAPGATDLSDLLLVGEGTSMGLELTLDKRLGELTGRLRYGFAWSSNQFDELNQGRPFRPRFDRRHEVFAALTYSLTDRWTLGILCLLTFNHVGLIDGLGESVQLTGSDGPLTGINSRYAEPYDLNGGRLPGFQRIELRTTYAFDALGVACEGTLTLLNGYGLIDPFRWTLTGDQDPRRSWRISFDAPAIMPVYPSLGFRARF